MIAETQEALSDHQETLFYFKGAETLAQVSQRGCGVSHIGDIHKLTGHIPGQLATGGSA